MQATPFNERRRLVSDFLDVTLGLDSLWQRIRAVDQLGLVVSKRSHTAHGISKFAGPFTLIADEALELFPDGWVDSELGIRWEDEDVLWRRSGIAVVIDVPDTRAVQPLEDVEKCGAL